MRVLQVGRSEAVEREHAIPAEDVVADAIAREVGELDRADADGARDRRALVLVEPGAAGIDDRAGARHRLVEQIGEAERAARARPQHLAIVAEDIAELHVHATRGRHEPARELADLPRHREVLCLGRADDVDEQARAEPLDAVAHGGQIGRRVVVAAVGLLHDDRHRLAVAAGEAGREDHARAVADSTSSPSASRSATMPGRSGL